MAQYRTVTATATVADSIVSTTGTVSNNAITATGDVGLTIHTSDYDTYAGATEVTPSAETQTLYTANTVVTSNIIINPIPSNYGLITWDGTTLTVS